MHLSGRTRMIASVNDLTGRDDCVEAVVVQERPPWAALASLGCLAVVLGITVALEPPIFVGQALVVAAVIVPLMFSGKRWIIARSGDLVVLAMSSKWWAKALELTERDHAPVVVGPGRGLLQKRVTLFGRQLIVAWPFLSRLRSITETPPAPHSETRSS